MKRKRSKEQFYLYRKEAEKVDDKTIFFINQGDHTFSVDREKISL